MIRLRNKRLAVLVVMTVTALMVIGVVSWMFYASTRDQINPTWADYHSELQAMAAKDAFSGVALVAKDSNLFLKQAYGLANRQENTKNTPDTLFNIASMGKMMTGVAIAQLAQQKKLSFDDTIDKYITELPPEMAKQITIHQLLTHTAGLGHQPSQEFPLRWQRKWR